MTTILIILLLLILLGGGFSYGYHAGWGPGYYGGGLGFIVVVLLVLYLLGVLR